MGPSGAQRWWQRGIVYQVYPRSFLDTNGDGIGDLPGVIDRLDYLAWLGVDAVWLSPIYPSPMRDFGYDVADYTGIDPLFGTLADFERLVSEAHRRGLRLLLDFVPNHTSDSHPWFVASRRARDGPRRSWYIWRNAKPDGSVPNNWLSNFGGSAWAWDEGTQQYYYHAFLAEQPDLNWRNPDVQAAMLDVMRFWLDRGVDGFRVDVIWGLVKDSQFRDNPVNPDFDPSFQAPHHQQLARYSADRPEVHGIISRMRAVVDEYDDRMMVGEIYLPVDRLMTYYGAAENGVHLPFNFQLVQLPWRADAVAGAIDGYEARLPPGAWPNWVIGNHDRPRVASRIGQAQARVAAMLLLTLRGTPTLYYGDEIGMTNVPVPPEAVRDCLERNLPGRGLGRDGARTPMQWSSGASAGFTSGTPWLPVGADLHRVNVETERGDPRSLLSLYRRLIALRRSEPALAVGSYAKVPSRGTVLAYARRETERELLVALNLGHEAAELDRGSDGATGRVLLSTHLDREGEAVSARLVLRADEGVVVSLDSAGVGVPPQPGLTSA
jgi:alpha-glucosidase